MPPSKVKIERIAGDRTRQNTFHKRKLGLIKKAIELTVLCDCECAIILRSGPTVTCQEGKLSAYCNKDLEKMLKDCMAELPMDYYTNAEYTRFVKESKDAGDEHEGVAAIEIDVEAGTHSHSHVEPRGAAKSSSEQAASGSIKREPAFHEHLRVDEVRQAETPPGGAHKLDWRAFQHSMSRTSSLHGSLLSDPVPRKRPAPPPIHFGGQFANHPAEPVRKAAHTDPHAFHAPQLAIARGAEHDPPLQHHFHGLERFEQQASTGASTRATQHTQEAQSFQVPAQARQSSAMLQGFFSPGPFYTPTMTPHRPHESQPPLATDGPGPGQLEAEAEGEAFTGVDMPVTPTNFDLSTIFPSTPTHALLPPSPRRGKQWQPAGGPGPMGTGTGSSSPGADSSSQIRTAPNPLFDFGFMRQ